MKISIKNIAVKDRFRKEMGDLQPLADSLAELGLLQPIGVVQEGGPDQFRLVFGERRLTAARDILGWTEIDVRVVDLDRLIAKESAENEVRKEFTPSERVAIGKAVERELEGRRGRPAEGKVQNFAELKGKKTRNIAAEAAGFGNAETYRQAKAVDETASPEIVAAMNAEEISIHRAYEMSKLPLEFQETLDKANAELDRAKREAEKAKREAEAERSKSADLLGQVKMLKENAEAVRIKAEREAEAKAAAERERLLAEIAEAKAESERIRREVEDAANAQAEAAAQAAIAKVEGEVKVARQKEAEAKRTVERLKEQKEFLDAKIREHQDYLSKIKGAEVEAKEILDALERLTEALVAAQLVFMDIDYEHDEAVMKKVRVASDQCRKMADMMSAAIAPRIVFDADKMQEMA